MNLKVKKETKEKRFDKIGSRGITLIALVITIIVLLILAGVTIATLIGDSGILTQAGRAKDQTEKAAIEEKIKLETMALKNGGTLSDLKDSLKIEGAEYEVGSKSMIVTTKEGYVYTVLFDGTIVEGKLVCLDIADGNIDLYSNGYKQYKGNLQNLNKNGSTEYTGKYIITGTTTENVVRVCDEGTYDITIRDLEIKLSADKGTYCAFNANRGSKTTDCYVNITLEGKNYLHGSGNAAGLGFVNGTPNVDGVTNGSTLTIQGEGSLEAKGAHYAAGIGSGYSGYEASAGQASNIIINSGNIKTTGGTHGSGIGGGLANAGLVR